jgi:hypothetical protein
MTVTKRAIVLMMFFCLQVSNETAAQDRQQSTGTVQKERENADIQESIAEWRKIPGIELVCIARALNRQGQTLESVLLKGIHPASPSLAEVRSQCK